MPFLSINAVSPGIILPHQSMKESTVEKLKESNLYKKWGVPEDVADAVVFLAESSFITGEVIHVDGGRHLIRGRNV
jgi:NAD(P)-dependent dehydrogenase (short-subunit alcohol dehydrogenase family)